MAAFLHPGTKRLLASAPFSLSLTTISRFLFLLIKNIDMYVGYTASGKTTNGENATTTTNHVYVNVILNSGRNFYMSNCYRLEE